MSRRKLGKRYKHDKEVGSPKLYRRTKKGRLVPATYGCGVNRKGKFPTKTKSWMTWDGELDTKSQHETQLDIGENNEYASTSRQIKYNIKHDIIEDAELDQYCTYLNEYEQWMQKALNKKSEL